MGFLLRKEKQNDKKRKEVEIQGNKKRKSLNLSF
jgi:hypothetical protein